MRKSGKIIWNFMPKAIVGLVAAILTANAYAYDMQTEICIQGECPSTGTITEENPIWSHIDPAMTPARTYTCYQGNNRKWLRIASVEGTCPQGTRKVTRRHNSTLCQKSYDYYDCESTTSGCTGCSNCDDTATWTADANNTGYEKRTTKTCNYTTCQCETGTAYRCAVGYYGTPRNSPSGCARCPSDGFPGTYGTTAAAGSKGILQCYIPAGAPFSDSTGAGVYPDRCDYEQDGFVIDACAIGDENFCLSDADCGTFETCNTETNCCYFPTFDGGDIVKPGLTVCRIGQSDYCDSIVSCPVGSTCNLETFCCELRNADIIK